MKVYGALEVAQIEWFTDASKPAPAAYPYRLIYLTDLKQILISDGTSWLPSLIQSYTNALLPAAGATNTGQVAYITDQRQLRFSTGAAWVTAGTRLTTYTTGTLPAAAAGNQYDVVWVSDLQQLQVSNGSSWLGVGTASGSKNYFSNSNANPTFETNAISPWTLFTTTLSGGVPTTLTASATQMAFAATSTNPLAGTYSGQLVKSAANAVGQGIISGTLTIDREDLGKVLYGSFNYELSANPANFDASGLSTQSLEIWVYNVTSATWTQPSGYRGINQTTGPGKVTFSFQTDSTPANNTYKVVILTAQTAATGYTINVDDFQLGPSAIVQGTPMTDWQSYTPTFTGLGTPTGVEFQHARVGSNLLIRGKWTNGTVSATEARVSLPTGLTSADTTKIPSIQYLSPMGNNYSAAFDIIYNTLIEPSVGYVTFGAYLTASASLTKINGTTLATGRQHSFTASIPIQGWSSNVQTSSDTDTRVVALAANKQNGSVTANTAIPSWTNTIKDTHGAFNATTGVYTVPVSGEYQVSFVVGTTASVALPLLYQNGSLKVSGVVSGTSRGIVSGILSCKAGDTIHVAISNSLTIDNALEDNYLSIHRLSGPSVITATETVSATMTSVAATSIPNITWTLVPFATVVDDSHGCFSTSTNLYTIPTSGRYRITTLINWVAGSTGSRWSAIYKNSAYLTNLGQAARTAENINSGGSVIRKFNAGDTIGIYVQHNDGGALALQAPTISSNQMVNSFMIERIGS